MCFFEEGLALFNALLLAIKRRYLGQDGTSIIFGPEEMAVKLECRLAEYNAVWRERNRKCELYRNKKVIIVFEDTF